MPVRTTKMEHVHNEVMSTTTSVVDQQVFARM